MRKSLAGLVAALMTATSVSAADLYQPEPVPVIDAPEVTVTEASGWYLRGDVGYSFNKLRGADYFQGSNATVARFGSTDVDNSFLFGAGVGYQINRHLRTDLTFDYLTKSDFKGSTRGSCGVALDCISTDRTSMTAYNLMANAYVDLGTYGYVTPYVGAGIGGAYVKWKDLQNTSCSVSNPANCDPTQGHGGKGSWRFAYALMAGASIDVTCNVKADIGYRFRQISRGDMFGYANNGGPGRDKGLTSHEARLGARYVFGGCETAAYEPPVEVPIQPAVYK